MSGVDKLADVRTATRTMLLCLLVTVQCVKQPLFHMTVCVLNYCSVYIVCYAVYGVQMCMLYISNGILGQLCKSYLLSVQPSVMLCCTHIPHCYSQKTLVRVNQVT